MGEEDKMEIVFFTRPHAHERLCHELTEGFIFLLTLRPKLFP